MIPALEGAELVGDAPPSFQEAHGGEAPGVLTKVKDYMRRKVYVSHNTPFFCATGLLSGSDRRPAAYNEGAALAPSELKRRCS